MTTQWPKNCLEAVGALKRPVAREWWVCPSCGFASKAKPEKNENPKSFCPGGHYSEFVHVREVTGDEAAE